MEIYHIPRLNNTSARSEACSICSIHNRRLLPKTSIKLPMYRPTASDIRITHDQAKFHQSFEAIIKYNYCSLDGLTDKNFMSLIRPSEIIINKDMIMILGLYYSDNIRHFDVKAKNWNRYRRGQFIYQTNLPVIIQKIITLLNKRIMTSVSRRFNNLNK